MSQFTAPLAVSPIDEKWWVILTDTFSYDVGFEGSSDKVKVPYGFTTDFASTPSSLWTLMGGPWGKYGNAAVIHDWLYYSQNRSKSETDRIFHEGMRVMGVPPVRAWMMWKAVSWFGGRAWKENARIAREHPETKMRPDVADLVLFFRGKARSPLGSE